MNELQILLQLMGGGANDAQRQPPQQDWMQWLTQNRQQAGGGQPDRSGLSGLGSALGGNMGGGMASGMGKTLAGL